MGNDLLLVAAKVEDLSVLHKRIGEATIDQLSMASDMLTGDDVTDEDASAFRKRLHVIVEDLFGDPRRDVVVKRIEGVEYWFTGGMSWGDDPCDAFNPFLALLEADIVSEGSTNAAVIRLEDPS